MCVGVCVFVYALEGWQKGTGCDVQFLINVPYQICRGA